MPHIYADRIQEVTTSTGTGSLALAGAPAGGFRPFHPTLAVGDTTDVCIRDPATDEWEVCAATLSGTTTLARGAIHASSAGGARVAFGAGAKLVYVCLPAAETMRRAEIAAALADRLVKASNLSDLASAADARTNLGLVIGTEVQAYSAILAALAGVSGAANKLPFFTGANSLDVTDIVAAARTLLSKASADKVFWLIDFGPSPPADNDTIAFIAPCDLTLPVSFAGSYLSGTAAATGSSAFTIKKASTPSGSAFALTNGTLTIAATAKDATPGAVSQTSIPAGSRVEIVGPATADATLAGVRGAIVFERAS